MTDSISPPFQAYSGSETYVFVSYAHVDKAQVFADIGHLHQDGLRIWYDEGIRAGTDWNEKLAQAIANASMVLLFVSPEAAESPYVIDELLKAKSSKKPILVVHLVETEMTDGLRMQLARWQPLFRYRLPEKEYWRALRDAVFSDPRKLDLAAPGTVNSTPAILKRLGFFENRKISPSETLAAKVQEVWLDSFLKLTLDEGIDISPPMTLIRKGTSKELTGQFSHARLFHGNRCRLLITGGAGAGKTIQLLEFVNDLMPAGANIDKRPIPIVLSIGTWVDKPNRPPEEQQSIREWIDGQFLVQWGLTKTLSKELIEGPQRIIYCLDGYDEIGGTTEIDDHPSAITNHLQQKELIHLRSVDNRPALRARFITLLREFIAKGEGEHAKGFLISSRTECAAELQNLIQLDFAELHINFLNERDVSAYLDSNHLTFLKALAARPEVLHQLTTPLQLQIFATVYPGTLSPEEVERLQADAEEDLQELLDSTYMDFFSRKIAAFERAGKELGRSAPSGLSSKDIHDFTRKIARYLENRRHQTFLLDRLQPSELPTRLRSSYRTVNALIFFFAGFLLAAVPVGVAMASEHWINGTPSSGIRYGLLAVFGTGIAGGGFMALGFKFSRGAWLGALIGLGFAAVRTITVGLFSVVSGSDDGMNTAERQGIASLLAIPLFAWIMHYVHEDPMQIIPVETWETDRRKAVIAVGIAALFGTLYGLLLGPARGISFGCAFALFMGSRFGKRERSIPIQVRPNQAIEFSARESWKHALVITLVSVVIFGAAYGYFIGRREGINNAELALYFLFTFFFFGGIPVLKHLALRLVLWRAKLLPWRTVRFLTTAARTGLMRQVGGGFQFSHTKVRDYFARQAHNETWGQEIH